MVYVNVRVYLFFSVNRTPMMHSDLKALTFFETNDLKTFNRNSDIFVSA